MKQCVIVSIMVIFLCAILYSVGIGQTVLRRYGDATRNIAFYDDGSVIITPGVTAPFIKYVAIHDNGNSGTAKTINWLNGNIQRVLLTGNCEFTFTNPLTGIHVFMLYTRVGYSITWPANVKWVNNTVPTFTANRTKIIEFYYDGTTYYGFPGDCW